MYDVLWKMLTNLLLKVWDDKKVHRVETCWLFDKEKVLGAVVSKEGHADLKEPITIDFFEKHAIANSAFY